MADCRQTFLKSTLVTLLFLGPWHALADTDFTRIKQDVAVMSRILKGAFESSGKVARGVGIEGNYLAMQGAVFTVHSSPALGWYEFRISDDDGTVVPVPPVAPIGPVDFDNISAAVEIALQGLDDADLLPALANLPGFHSAIDTQNDVNRETRVAIRDLTRDLREVEREISEHRIQMIQAEDDSEKAKLQTLLAGLEKQRGDYEARLSGLESTLEAEKAKLAARRAEMREKASLTRRQQMDALESTVMQYLCDYGGTLRNLPDKEHVSIVFKQLTAEGQAQIYVFARDDVLDCRTDGKRLKERATAYLF